MISRAFCVVLALTLASCAHNRSYVEGNARAVTVQPNANLPAPTRADIFSQDRPYLIGPFDKLVIDVFGIPEMSNKEVQTDAGGRISFPVAGVIQAAGQSPAELATMLERRLHAGGIRNPQVSVNLRETVSQVITVDGQVKEPGLYPVIGRMTLMRAVATAKGTDEFAKLSEVVVIRTVAGQKYAGLYSLKAIRAGAYPDPEVYANDVVIVGESYARRVFKDALSVLPILVTPIIVALQ